MNKFIKSQKCSNTDHRSIKQIRGSMQSIHGRDVRYRLFEVRRSGAKSYAVNVSFGGENVSRGLGYGKRSAVALFNMLVDGAVTPATLGDIVDDWEAECRGAV